MSIEVIRGDITRLKVDAIVNAANNSLLGGGGVDGAIHSAAGTELIEECRKLNGCATGEAKITKGYKLPAAYVIHTVGPIWRDGKNKEIQLLASCYRNCLNLAIKHNIKSIAFPNISTGIYGFPKEAAAEIAISEIKHIITNHESIEKIIFVCYDEDNYQIYSDLLT